MTTENTYYVQVLNAKALLILRSDYEDNSCFPSEPDRTTYSLIDTIDLETYQLKLNNEKDNSWKKAIKVNENHEFIETTPGAWCQYQYQTEGCGKTTEERIKTFI